MILTSIFSLVGSTIGSSVWVVIRPMARDWHVKQYETSMTEPQQRLSESQLSALSQRTNLNKEALLPLLDELERASHFEQQLSIVAQLMKCDKEQVRQQIMEKKRRRHAHRWVQERLPWIARNNAEGKNFYSVISTGMSPKDAGLVCVEFEKLRHPGVTYVSTMEPLSPERFLITVMWSHHHHASVIV